MCSAAVGWGFSLEAQSIEYLYCIYMYTALWQERLVFVMENSIFASMELNFEQNWV